MTSREERQAAIKWAATLVRSGNCVWLVRVVDHPKKETTTDGNQ